MHAIPTIRSIFRAGSKVFVGLCESWANTLSSAPWFIQQTLFPRGRQCFAVDALRYDVRAAFVHNGAVHLGNPHAWRTLGDELHGRGLPQVHGEVGLDDGLIFC